MSQLSPDFITHGIVLTDSPLGSSEFDDYCDELLRIEPSLLTSSVVHGRNVDIIVAQHARKKYSYPEIQEKVAYRVVIMMDFQKEELLLSNIYLYKNPTVIRELLNFLANIEVANNEDLQMSRNCLMELLFSLEGK